MDGIEDTYKQFVFQTGAAFRAPWQFGTDPKPKFRFFFVLNKNPQDDDDIVVVTTTTKIEKRYKNRFYKVLVNITAEDYKELSESSVVDCASAFTISKANIIEMIADNKIQLISKLPEEIFEKIKAAIESSKTLKPKIKRLVLGDSIDL